VCLSAEGDLVAGVVVLAIGVDACRHLKGRSEYLFVAGLPLLLGFHQVVEAFVWWGLEGHVPEWIGQIAMWLYLLVAFVAMPVFVPALVWRLEPTPARRRRIVPFMALGVAVGAWLLIAMLRTTPTAELQHLHIAYSAGLDQGVLVVGLYVVATCGAMLASGLRHVVWFGIANLVAVVVLARLTADGFASLWCFYAALASAAIATYLRVAGHGDAEDGDAADGARQPDPGPVTHP
jgi:hypothetical protein